MYAQPLTIATTDIGSGAQRVAVKPARLSAQPVVHVVREVNENGKSTYQVQNWRGQLVTTADTYGLAIGYCIDNTH